jgi:two-component system, LuxR family, sensor kinase FixL
MAGPHVAQVLAGVTFIAVVARRLDVSFAPKVYEAARRRAEAERERAYKLLAERAAQQAAVAELGRRALSGIELPRLLQGCVELVVKTLRADVVGVFELTAGPDLVLRAGTGWSDRDIGPVSIGPTDSAAGHVLHHDEPAIVDDWRTERRFPILAASARAGALSAVWVRIAGRGRPFGVLGVQSRKAHAFGAEDVDFLQALAHVLAEAIERRQAEHDSRHQALHDALTGLPNRALLGDRLPAVARPVLSPIEASGRDAP